MLADFLDRQINNLFFPCDYPSIVRCPQGSNSPSGRSAGGCVSPPRDLAGAALGRRRDVLLLQQQARVRLRHLHRTTAPKHAVDGVGDRWLCIALRAHPEAGGPGLVGRGRRLPDAVPSLVQPDVLRAEDYSPASGGRGQGRRDRSTAGRQPAAILRRRKVGCAHLGEALPESIAPLRELTRSPIVWRSPQSSDSSTEPIHSLNRWRGRSGLWGGTQDDDVSTELSIQPFRDAAAPHLRSP